MYLLKMSTMLSMFCDEDEMKKNKNLCHQDLLAKDMIIRFEDLPLGAFVMFISHQWTGSNHPDPNSRHMSTLCQILRDLRDGRYNTETDPFHVLCYKLKTVTSVHEWKSILSKNVYIWYDWFSQPQPLSSKSTEESAILNEDLKLALDSVGAYVERADMLVILTPSSVHQDKIDEETGRKTYTCYRTWRKRGFCVLEFFCANMSRRSTHPVLLVRSVLDRPMWISPLESMSLAVGR